jgi:hypothetical protein
MTPDEFRATPQCKLARTTRMNLVWLHQCGKAMGYPTALPVMPGGVYCDGCAATDTNWRALQWDDPVLRTAPGVPALMERGDAA